MHLRIEVGKRMNMVEDNWRPLWVVDFPMFEHDERENRWQASTSSVHGSQRRINRNSGKHKLDDDPGKVLSRAYDMVLNGSEVGGGSIRIHDTDMQQKALDVLGIDEHEANDKFGFLWTH